MQHAKCLDDGKIWEALDFSVLPPLELELKRKNLECVQCGEFAWFRKESAHGHPAHFCAHHKEDCDLRVEYIVVDDPRNEATLVEGEVAAGDSIIVRLDQEKGNKFEVMEVQPPPTPGHGEGGRAFIIQGKEKESFQHFTLRKILLRLVQSKNFRTSNTQILLLKNENEPLIQGSISEKVTNFSDISPEKHDNQVMLFWGPIASAKTTIDGKLWLNSSNRYQGSSVAIFNNIVKEFLEIFDISDLDELAGAHVLVAGRCTFSAAGKPVIWCASPKYIVIRRYKDEKLKAHL